MFRETRGGGIVSDGESIAGREREVTFHTSSALTPHFFTEFDKEARSRESRDPFYHDAVRLVEEYRAALNTITQQAQELEQAKGNYAIQKAAADGYEQQLAAMTTERDVMRNSREALMDAVKELRQQLAAAQARCREMEREIETLTTCGCEGCDDNLEESAFCFPCMNTVQQQVTQLQATLAAREARIHDLERGLAAILQVLNPFTEPQQARGSSGGAANQGAGT